MSWAAAAAAGSRTYHGGGRSPWSPWGAGDAIVQMDKLRNDGRGKQAVIIILYYIRVNHPQSLQPPSQQREDSSTS